MPMPRALARFNRRVTNPIQRLWAGRLPGYAIIEHTGRKSGKQYRSPVNAFRTPDGFAFAVNYGVESDWVQNLLAAGGGHVVYRRKRVAVGEPTLVTGPEGLSLLPALPRALVRRLGVDNVLRVTAG
ncbi:MAG: nitroreductase family deazaflavin-dependent oxidoreductase [Acidimicrobiales bacterium]